MRARVSLRGFIRTHFSRLEHFNARDVTKALKEAGITPKRGAVTDALWHTNKDHHT